MHTTLLRRTASALLIGAALAGIGHPAVAGAEETGLHGHPDTAAEYWSEQSYDDCAIMASAHVIGILTGDMPEEDDIVAVAGTIASRQHDGPIYVVTDSDDPDVGGTDPEDLPILLAHYGIRATYTDNEVAGAGGLQTGLSALDRYLDDGRAVIASVNSYKIWNEPDDDGGAHAVVVTGVDTDRAVVHLNDSGTDDGADEQVSISMFQSAWNDLDQRMVVTAPY